MLHRWRQHLVSTTKQAAGIVSCTLNFCYVAFLVLSMGGFGPSRASDEPFRTTESNRRDAPEFWEGFVGLLGESPLPDHVVCDVYNPQIPFPPNPALKRRLKTILALKFGLLPACLLIDAFPFPPDIQGGGGGSNVFRSRLRGVDVAIKLPRPSRTSPTDVSQDILLSCHEASIMEAASHPRVLSIIGIFLTADGKHLALVSKWCTNGHMDEYLRDHVEETPRILFEVTDAICYLHLLGIVHNDIHFTNVLIDEEGHVQLSDFGISDWTDPIEPNPRAIWGRSDYKSPQKDCYPGDHRFPYRCRTSDDMFALGSLLYQAYTGRSPFTSGKIHYSLYARINHDARPPCPRKDQCRTPLPDPVWQIILRCWSNQPLERPSAVDVRQVLLSYYFSNQVPQAALAE